MIDLKIVLEQALQAVVEGGKIINKHTDDITSRIIKESYRDVATELDGYIEAEIVKRLKDYNVEIPIIAEESGLIAGVDRKYKWVIDPLDGTVNFISGIPLYGTSIAFMENNKFLVGVFYNPKLEELYYGCRDVGVFKNHKHIQIKDNSPEKSLFAATFSGKNYDPETRGREFELFGKINDMTMGCLRTGSAAVNLAYLAEGRFGGCFGKANKLWDVGAGLLLAEMAGAKIWYEQIDDNLVNYIAAAPGSWDLLHNEVGNIFG
jgi:myo-inositol-1(or 4)-monophosphatase